MSGITHHDRRSCEYSACTGHWILQSPTKKQMYNHCYKSTRQKTEKIITNNTLASQNSWKYSAGSFALKATSVLLHSTVHFASLIHPFFSQLISSLLVWLDKGGKKKRYLPNRSPDTWHLHTPFAIYSEYKSKNNISTAKSLFATLYQNPFSQMEGREEKNTHIHEHTESVNTDTGIYTPLLRFTG